MKIIKTYDSFNESVRDHMKPKSEEDINNALMKQMKSDRQGTLLGYFNPLQWGLTLGDYIDDNNHYLTIFIFTSKDGRKWKITTNDNKHSYSYSVTPLLVREIKKGVGDYYADNYEEVEEYLMRKGLRKTINESIRDMMKPKTEEELLQSSDKLTKYDLLEMACLTGYESLLLRAIERGVNIRLDEDRPIRIACSKGHLNIVKILIDKGANVSTMNEYPIRTAAYHKHKDIVEYLLAHGVNIDNAIGEEHGHGHGLKDTLNYLKQYSDRYKHTI